MAPKLEWDKTTERLYETGVDRVVLFPVDANGTYPLGVAWNGVTAISESPSGAEANDLYADNQLYLSLTGVEKFGATIEAYTYPDAFAVCDGSAAAGTGVKIGQQPRKGFGLCYRTKVGSDTEGDGFGYKLHFVYGCKVAPSERGYNTVGETPEATALSWEITTVPVSVTGMQPTSTVVVDSTLADPTDLAALEAIIYGTAGTPGTNARLPLPDEIIGMFAAG
jgi:hypothetical protein